MWLWLELVDVGLFRDARPFRAEEAGRAKSVFPPYPTTLGGMVRSAILARVLGKQRLTFADWSDPGHPRLAEVRAVLGHPRTPQPGSMVVRGPVIGVWDSRGMDIRVPVPQDVLGRESRAGDLRVGAVLSPLEVETTPGRASPPALRPLWSKQATGGSAEAVEGGFLDADNLERYLSAREGGGGVQVRKDDDLVRRESRMGIALQRGKTVEEGMLYTVEYVRPATFREEVPSGHDEVGPLWREARTGVLVSLEGAGVDELWQSAGMGGSGVVPLGGEQRAAYYEAGPALEDRLRGTSGPLTVLDRVRARLLGELSQAKPWRFKLVLLTPAVFTRHGTGTQTPPGWLPDFADAVPVPSGNGYEAYRCAVGGLRFRLVAAAVGKPAPVSGWDLMKSQPRPARLAVPAGSVYYFELDEGDWPEVFERFWLGSLLQSGSGDLTEDGRAGFGLTLIGRW